MFQRLVQNYLRFLYQICYFCALKNIIVFHIFSIFTVKETCSDPKLYCKYFDCTAGVRPSRYKPEYESIDGEFPEAAALFFKASSWHEHVVHNGVLISELFVLTTAASLEDKRSKLEFVKLGLVS